MIRSLAAILAAALVLTACAAVQRERSVGRSLDDASASLGIKSAMIRAEGYALDAIEVEVTDGLVLLAGTAPRETDRMMAECLAWSSPSVRSVANEVRVAATAPLRDRANDLGITQSINASLIGDRAVRSVNYNVQVYNGVVYLLGVARSRGELDRVTAHASLAQGVSRVVSYVRVHNEPAETISRGERRAAACGGEALPSRSGASELLGAPDLAPPTDVRTAPVTPID